MSERGTRGIRSGQSAKHGWALFALTLLVPAGLAAQSIDLAVTSVSGPATGATGSTATYTVSVTGAGATGVWVTTVFTPAVTFNSGAGCSPPNTGTGDASTTVTCPWTGSNVTIQVTFLSVGTLNVVAGVIGNQLDPVMSNNSGSKTTAVSAGAPTVSVVSPAMGPTAGGTGIAIYGTNFVAGATVKLGTTFATGVIVQSSTTITATTPSHSAGAVNVVVTNPDTQMGTLTNGFTYGGEKFYTVTPCRVLDTRNANGPYGGPALSANAARTFTVTGQCGIPTTAKSVSVNVAVTGPSAAGYLILYPTGIPLPNVFSINYGVGQTRANNVNLTLSASGNFTVSCAQASGTVHFILDVNGYFQ
jgi:hypothetical protein